MERTTILLLILCLILSVLFITFLVLYVKKGSESVSKNNVPKVLSSYATIPNVQNTDIKPQYTCSGTGTADGQIGTKLCSFNGVSSLFQAIDTCNTYTFSTDSAYANCTGFYYNPTNSTVQFINTQYQLTGATQDSSSNGDVYLRQFNF